jgi:hypothetical protein
MEVLQSHVEGGDQVFAVDGSRWLTELRVLTVEASTGERRTGSGESLLIVLDGTFDLFAGGGSWARRGIRATPFEGRPVALFLPPDTPFRAENGHGRIALVSSRQPELPKPETDAEERGRKPLLQLAGSGKAFDAVSQSWKPKEAFLTSPEALLPRRFERLDAGDGLVVERIAGADYKALSLRVDECTIPVGRTLTAPSCGEPSPEECAVLVVSDGGAARVGSIGVTGVAALRADGPTPAPIAAGGACPCYALIVYAGSKLPSTT